MPSSDDRRSDQAAPTGRPSFAPKTKPHQSNYTVASSELELAFAGALRIRNLERGKPKLPIPDREVVFHDGRRWRFDFAWIQQRVAVELDGGTRNGGRHVRAAGFEGDCEKLNEAAMGGWTVLRFTAAMVDDGRALAAVERALEGRCSE
jgi:hypothetical protein